MNERDSKLSSIEEELLFFPHGRGIPATSVIHSRLHDLYPNFGLDVCNVVKLTFNKCLNFTDNTLENETSTGDCVVSSNSTLSTSGQTRRKSSNSKLFNFIHRIRNNSSYIYYLVVAKSIGYPEKVLNLYRLNVKTKVKNPHRQSLGSYLPMGFNRQRRVSRSHNSDERSHSYAAGDGTPRRGSSTIQRTSFASMSASSSTDNVFVGKKNKEDPDKLYNVMEFVSMYPTKLILQQSDSRNKSKTKKDMSQSLKVTLNQEQYKFRNKHDLSSILKAIS